MRKVDAPYLVAQVSKSGGQRFYFAPRQDDRAAGWATVRLHDAAGLPIRDLGAAITACAAVAGIYVKWRAGLPGMGPHLIDKLGRVVQPVKPDKRRRERAVRIYRPGQIGAMVADYMDHDIFKVELEPKTQKEYKFYLNLFVDEFGELYWPRLSAGAAREWLVGRALEGGKSGAHALYRTVRSFFSQIRLVYTDPDHPGIVAENENPFVSLKLSLPSPNPMPWPREAVRAFVDLADDEGEPSMGDAMIVMSWIGARRQDWLEWPAEFFDRPLIAFRQNKTDVPNVIPWDMIPELVVRVKAARQRLAASTVRSSKFFHDRTGKPWGKPGRFRAAFNRLRAKMVAQHPSFATRYYVGLIEGDPLAVPTEKLTIRTLRHTCVTFNYDAGVSPQLIPGITGHSADEVEDILKHYRARTADQAAAALQMRLDHEAKEASA